ASNRGIDEIRDLREKVAFSPNTGKAKIYIIDEVHMLTKEAFNALLKTLEEPPSHAYFILATTEYHKVPDTIRSRCQTFFFTNIAQNEIAKRLEYICKNEKFEYTKEGLDVLAKRANGGLRDAISLLEQSSNFGDITVENLQKSLGIISADFLEKFLHSLQTCDIDSAFTQLKALQNEGRSLQEFGKDFLEYLQETFHIYIKEKNALLPWLLEIITIFEEGLQRSKRFEIPPLALEMAIVKAILLNKEFTAQLKNITTIQSDHKNTPLPVEKITKEVTPKPTQAHFAEDTTNDLFPPATSAIPAPTQEIISEELPPWEVETKEPRTIVEPKKIIPKKNTNFIKKLETASTTESKKVLNAKKEEVKKQAPPKIEKIIKPIDTPEDDEMLPVVQSQWKTLCSTLPKSVKLYLSEYGIATKYENKILTLEIKGDFAKKMINTEKNITIISEKFSHFLSTKITISILEKKETKADNLSISDVEGLLQF
ncbi:TPA: AAA family ATPase, partial [Candidatus Gracilibacteria bacterium]|nr:AAA family ATPase [Candidatus Gracilibacteria bacterium]